MYIHIGIFINSIPCFRYYVCHVNLVYRIKLKSVKVLRFYLKCKIKVHSIDLEITNMFEEPFKGLQPSRTHEPPQNRNFAVTFANVLCFSTNSPEAPK